MAIEKRRQQRCHRICYGTSSKANHAFSACKHAPSYRGRFTEPESVHCQRQNIQIHFEVNDLSNLQLDSVDITTILGNLLDNAIEACVIYGENSQIQVKVLLGNTLFFAIRNTCKPVKIIGEYIPTTKPNAQLHGFGLENVKTLLRKYNGEYAMEYDEGWFTFTGEIDNYPIL